MNTGRSPSGRAAAASAVEPVPVSSIASIPNAYAVAPKRGCADYLTAGRAYPILREDDDGEGFYITNDIGTESYCLWRLCGHLQYGDVWENWTRLERPASAIEARSDATGTGAAEGESAAPQEDAQ